VLNAQVEYQGLDDDLRGSGDRMTDANFINYILGAQFEAPIGNRAAEADFQRARLQRQSTVLAYRNTAQGVVLEVKQALRDLVTAWRLISVNRSARRAAAENLRALLEREERGEALTPEFLLDLKLSTQQRLADAETREVQSIIDYNNAIARLHQATGTLLEHNQINMQWPTNMFADE
jgi:outer membrane protein TolC